MNLTIPRAKLLGPLKSVAPLASGKQTLPILSHVLLTLDAGGTLHLTTTDTESQISVRVALTDTASDRWECCIPARKLFDIVRLLPDGSDVKLEPTDCRVRITSGRSRYHISTLPAEQFPAFDAGDLTRTLTIESALLLKALESVAPAQGITDVRYYLNGTLIRSEDGELTVVASDGHRIARYTIAAECPDSERLDCIVPRSAAGEIVKLLRDISGTVTLRMGARNCEIDAGPISFATRLIDGKYSAFERLLPDQFLTTLTVGTADLAQALARVGTLAHDSRGVRITVRDGCLDLEASNNEHGDAADSVDASVDGEERSYGYNLDYLSSALSYVSDARAVMQIADRDFVVITDPADPAYLAMVAPMRL